MHQKKSPTSPGKATVEGAVDTGEVGEVPAAEVCPTAAWSFLMRLILASCFDIYIYICMQMGSLPFFQSRGGGGLRCLDLLINAACWTSHRIHSHQVQASFKSLFGHHCPRKL